MGDRGKSFVGATQRSARGMRAANKAFWVVTLGVLALAAALVRAAPIASAALAATFTCAFGVRWFVQRGGERLVDAGDRADLDALRAAAAGVAFKYPALVALAVFDGPAAVESVDHVFCECGNPDCLAGPFQSDLAMICASLRKVDTGGSWTQAAKAIIGEEISPGTNALAAGVNATRVQVRMALLNYAAFRSLRIEVPPKTLADPLRGVVGVGRVLRGAIRFAAALHAKARGDLAEARAQLAQLPPWKPGSRLARERAELEAELR